MKAPAFWHALDWRGMALAPLGVVYGLATAARMRLVTGHCAKVPVVCVGNFTLGGAGKTPTVIALCELLKERGEHPFVLSRGYGGNEAGPRHVDLKRDTADLVGDEPMLIAQHADVVIGRDRVAAAEHAERLGASILVMDDGMQNPGLAKTLTLAVVDGGTGFGNGLTFPAGPLRAPFALQIRAVDALLVIGEGDAGRRIATAAEKRGLQVAFGRIEPTPESGALKGLRVLGFCGIGQPDKFRATIREVGADLVRFRAFPDHHVLSRPEADDLITLAAEQSLALVTTEKDQMRLLGHLETRGLLAGLANVIRVRLKFLNRDVIDRLIDKVLAGRG